MQSMIGKTFTLFVLIAALGFPAWAEEAPTKTQKAGEMTEVSETIEPQHMTCEDLLVLLDDEEQEEELSYLAAWAYGLRTGAKGLDFEKYPVTMAGLESFVTQLVFHCKSNPEKLFVDAVLE